MFPEKGSKRLIEAFALGKPVIGAHIGGIPELVRDNQTGLTFEPGNILGLRDKINMLPADPGKIRMMGENARRVAEREFSAGVYYERLMALYNSVLSKK